MDQGDLDVLGFIATNPDEKHSSVHMVVNVKWEKREKTLVLLWWGLKGKKSDLMRSPLGKHLQGWSVRLGEEPNDLSFLKDKWWDSALAAWKELKWENESLPIFDSSLSKTWLPNEMGQ